MVDRPRILVTNDDGIGSTGIRLLEQVARTLSDDVWIVAPDRDHSGAGHSLTLRRPLRAGQLDERHCWVDGTPTDCVLLALQQLIPDGGIDLVLSGINHGGNLGEDVTYSGTIAAAMEATMFKVPAIAFSMVYANRREIRWPTAERWLPDLVARLAAMRWSEDVMINVNLPDRDPEDVRGVLVTTQGKRKLGDDIVERIDPRGESYIWIGHIKEHAEVKPGTDLHAVAEGFISVTPIHLDMTHRESFPHLRAVLGD